MSAPYMQLYVADYLGDTRHLTTEQHGAYLLLLMTMWRSDGVLPKDDAKLARIVGLTVARWKRISDDVMAFFDDCEGGITSRHLVRWKREAIKTAGRQPLSASTRAFVLERDGYQCAYCQTIEGPFEVDHILAVALGGGDELENLVCACRTCNRSKAAKTLAEWCAA